MMIRKAEVGGWWLRYIDIEINIYIYIYIDNEMRDEGIVHSALFEQWRPAPGLVPNSKFQQ